MLRAIEKWPNEVALVSREDKEYTFMEYFQNSAKYSYVL